jgi:hypothetical protein
MDLPNTQTQNTQLFWVSTRNTPKIEYIPKKIVTQYIYRKNINHNLN